MSTTELHSINSIKSIDFNTQINGAVQTQSNADFAMLLALLNNEINEPHIALPAEPEKIVDNTPKQPLFGAEQERLNGERVSELFHQGSITSAKLAHALNPEALAFRSELHHGLGEDVFHNLSYYQQQELVQEEEAPTNPLHSLHSSLIDNMRLSQLGRVA